jgi:hypothetical protein
MRHTVSPSVSGCAVDGEQWPGYYEFLWCTSEDSATPLLDIQVAVGVKLFEGLESLTISDFSAADRVSPRCECTYLHT